MDGEEVLRLIPSDMVNDGVGSVAALLQGGGVIGDDGQGIADGIAHDTGVADPAVFGIGFRNGPVDVLDGGGGLVLGLTVFLHGVHTGKERFTQANKAALQGKALGLEGGHTVAVLLGDAHNIVVKRARGVGISLQAGDDGRLEHIARDVLSGAAAAPDIVIALPVMGFGKIMVPPQEAQRTRPLIQSLLLPNGRL